MSLHGEQIRPGGASRDMLLYTYVIAHLVELCLGADVERAGNENSMTLCFTVGRAEAIQGKLSCGQVN
jgi:hypothetical protein